MPRITPRRITHRSCSSSRRPARARRLWTDDPLRWFPAVSLIAVLLTATACEKNAEGPDPEPTPPASASVSTTELEGRCRDNDAAACDELGAMYLLGHGVQRDPERAKNLRRKAVTLLSDACDAGDKDACEHVPARRPPPPPPPTPSAAAPDETPLRQGVTINRQGEALIDGDVHDDAALEAEARKMCADASVVIHADKEVAHSRLIAILDILKRAGCKRIAFGVDQATP